MSAVDQIRRQLALARAEQARQRLQHEQQGASSFLDELSLTAFGNHVAELEQELHLAEAESRRETVEWHLEGSRVRFGSVPLPLLAKLAEHFNAGVTKGAWRLRNALDIRNVPRDFVDLLDLRLAALRSGSARVIFTGQTAPDLAGTSLLADTFHHTFALLKADAKSITDPVSALGLRSTNGYAEWLKALQSEGVSAELRWHDDQHVPHEWGALPSDMARVRDRLAALSETKPVASTLAGEVVTLADTGRIQIKLSDGKKATVRYPRKLYSQAQALHLGERVTLAVWHTRLANQDTGRAVDRYALRALPTD